MSKGFYKEQEWQEKGWDKLMEAAVFVENWIKNAAVIGLKTEIIFNKEQNLTPLIFV